MNYRFSLHYSDAASENLGGVALHDDDEALAFGKQMIRDLMHEDAEQYVGCTVNITEGERVVGGISFEFQ
jgi:hypothetical protein